MTQADRETGKGWRPIETAKKKRERVLLTSAKYHYVVVGYYGPFDEEPDAWRSDWDNGSLEDDPHYDFRPTHWMPLPPPPSPSSEG